MANTRDTLGEQATLDALVGHSITSFEDDGITQIGTYGLAYQENLEEVNFSNLTSISSQAFYNSAKLQKVEIGATCNIGNNSFSGCTLLKSLILSGNGVSTLDAIDSFNYSNFAKCTGGIYVHTDKVSNYKTDTKWSTYRHVIFPITDYPRSNYVTITDTWTQIIAASNDGTYSSKYNIGDTATLTINGTDYLVALIAKDADVKASGGGNAHMTWLLVNPTSVYSMNSSNVTTGGWGDSELRTLLSDTVLPSFPVELQTAIIEVSKTYYDYGDSATKTCTDKIWIPSSREVCFSGLSLMEDSGVQYSDYFGNNISLVKYNISGRPIAWWLRSAYSNTKFMCITTGGSSSSQNASSGNVAALGFCI